MVNVPVDTPQLAVFIRTICNDFETKEEHR